MAVELIDKIKPKNNGSFPMVDAKDVEMPDGKRLDELIGLPKADYTDVMPEFTQKIRFNSSFGMCFSVVPKSQFLPTIGETYFVVADGVTYKLVCKEFGEDGSVTIGDTTLFETGHFSGNCPFAIIFSADDDSEYDSMYYDSNVDVTVTLRVYQGYDDGKVLTVVGDTWKAKPPTQIVSPDGSGLPSVTFGDIVADQSVTFTFDEGMNVFVAMIPSTIAAFTEGKTYYISYNGNDYQCTAESFDLFGQSLIGFGDTALPTNNAWTGDVPFLCAVFPPSFTGAEENLIGFAVDVQEETTAALRIYECTDDGKFLRVVNGKWGMSSIPFAEGASF